VRGGAHRYQQYKTSHGGGGGNRKKGGRGW
jgi:hypothetical protein